jgi:hypothetical protein
MFKRLGVVTILVVLALMTSVPTVSALGQISDTGVIWVDPLQYTPVQVPIPDTNLPVAEPAQAAPAVPAKVEPPDHVEKVQKLITGSFWIEFDERVIHIKFNARAEEAWEGVDLYDATGHIHWREVGGDNYRMPAVIVGFETPFPEGHDLWWPADCGFVRGLFETDEGLDMMCLQVCGDRVHNLFWAGEHIFSGSFTRGNVVIKK